MKQIKFFYLFIFFIVLGLRCGLWAFSSFGKQALESLGSVAEAHGLSCPGACGIFSDQGSNPCLLHWQAGSSPRRRQGSLRGYLFEGTEMFWN